MAKPKAKKQAAAAGGPTTWADMAVEYVDPRTIKADPRNPRQITPANRERLRGIIRRYGFVEPFLLRAEDGELIGGHQRLTIAIEEGYATVPVVRRTGLTKPEARALGIALNNPAAQGLYDEDALRAMLGDLHDDGLLDVTGFEDADLLQMELEQPEVKERPTPSAPKMAWWLIGVPIEQAIEVGDLVERLHAVEGAQMWATVSSDRPRAK